MTSRTNLTYETDCFLGLFLPVSRQTCLVPDYAAVKADFTNYPLTVNALKSIDLREEHLYMKDRLLC